MTRRVIILVLLLCAAAWLTGCSGALPGWGRESIDHPAAPGTDWNDQSPGGGGNPPPAPPSSGDDDNNPPPPPPGGGGDDDNQPPVAEDVIGAVQYDRAHAAVHIEVDYSAGVDVLLNLACSGGAEITGGNTHLMAGGQGAVDVTLEFTDPELLAAVLDITAYRASDSAWLCEEQWGCDRPLYLTAPLFDAAQARLTGYCNAADTAEVTIALTLPAGAAAVGGGTQQFTGSGDYEYQLVLDPLAFQGGTATIAAADQYGNAHQRSVDLSEQAYAADTLYAYAPGGAAQVGEPVTVVVATGRPAHPLQFLADCSVTIESQGAYVPNSFNYGAPGGNRTDSDGLWGQMGIPNGLFLDLGDDLVPGPGTAMTGGRHVYEFAIVSQGPYPAADAEGILLNFKLTFSAPGTYHLGLRQTGGAFDTLYYCDADGNNYHWASLLAGGDGVLNPSVANFSNVIAVSP
jgi:hypothetical protein